MQEFLEAFPKESLREFRISAGTPAEVSEKNLEEFWTKLPEKFLKNFIKKYLKDLPEKVQEDPLRNF